jgi:DNA-binding beta-propeller fold protein YncE
MTYNAFISYSHSDCGNIAPAMQKAIENIGKPWYKIGRYLTVFRDETNLAASPKLWSNIENALSSSEYLIFLASPKAANSYWINKELEKWCSIHYSEENGLQNIFIAITSGEILWDNSINDFNKEKTDCIPSILSNKFKEEPLFIDLREYVSNDLKQIDQKSPAFISATTKIIGAILGKTPREIESEETKRNKNIKWALFFFIGILLLLILSSLLLFWRGNEKDKIVDSERNKVQANQLISEAKTILETDPTLALRLVEEAMKISTDNTFWVFATKIYKENSFYKVLTHIDSSNLINKISFSPEGRTVIVETNKKILFFDLEGRLITELIDRKDLYGFSPFDTAILVLKNKKSTLQVIDRHGKLISETTDKNLTFTHSFWLSPTGERAIIANLEGYYIWEISKNTFTAISKNYFSVPEIHFSRDGKYIALSAIGSDSIYLWDNNGELLYTALGNGYSLSPNNDNLIIWKDSSFIICNFYGDTIAEENIDKSIKKLSFSSNGTEMYAHYWDGTINVLDSDGSIIEEFEGCKRCAPTDDYIFLKEIDGNIVLLKDLSGNVVKKLLGHSDKVVSVGYAPTRGLFLTASRDNTVRLWETKNKLDYSLNDGTLFSSLRFRNGKAKYGGMLQINYKTERALDTASSQKKYSPLILNTNGSASKIKDRNDSITREDFVVYTPKNKKILSQTNDTLTLFNTNCNILKTYSDASNKIDIITFSKDGELFLISKHGSITLFTSNSLEVQEIKLTNEVVEDVQFSPNGKNILIKTSTSIKIFDLQGHIVMTRGNLQVLTKFIGFSADGQKILLRDKNSIQVWSSNGTIINNFPTDIDYGDHLVFSPDGKFVYTFENNNLEKIDLNGNSLAMITTRDDIDFIRFENMSNSILIYTYDEVAKWSPPMEVLNFLNTGILEPLSKQQKQKYSIR